MLRFSSQIETTKGLKVANAKMKLHFAIQLIAMSFAIVLQSIPTSAAPSSESRAAYKTAKIESDAPSFYSSLSMDLSSNLYKEKSFERQSGLDLTVAAGYLWNKSVYTSASGVISADLQGQQNSTLSNFRLTQGKKYLSQENFKAQYYAFGIAPTNEDARKIGTFQGGLGFGHSMSVSFKNFILPYDLKLGLELQKNFHEYNMGADGSLNSEYNFSAAPGITLKVTDKFWTSLTGTYITVRTYQGNLKQKFDSDIFAGYQLSKQLSCNLGIANRGDLLKDNGVDTNLTFFNDQTNVLHAGILWQL